MPKNFNGCSSGTLLIIDNLYVKDLVQKSKILTFTQFCKNCK